MCVSASHAAALDLQVDGVGAEPRVAPEGRRGEAARGRAPDAVLPRHARGVARHGRRAAGVFNNTTDTM